MTSPERGPAAAPADGTDMSRPYILALVVEAVVLLCLYWLGRHFG